MWTLLLAAATLNAAEKPKLMVLELTPVPGVDAAMASTLTDAIATEVASRGFFEVVSTKDVQTLLGVERQRQLMGCSEEGRCLTELAGAIGTRFVLTGQLGKLGDAFQLTLETLDSHKEKPLGRSTHIASSPQVLRSQIAYMVAEATGTPLPQPPSHWLPYSVIGVGAAAVLAGGYFGVDGLSREGQVRSTIQAGQQGQTPLASLAFYQHQEQSAAQEKTAALVLLGGGAAAVAAGLLLNPGDPRGQIALVPVPNGLAFAGAWR
jgi:hypothetical protein